MKYNYVSLKLAIEVHDLIINLSGGRSGELNIEYLESTLTHVKNDEYYSSIEEKITYLVYSIAMNHAFVDGNKRSAITIAMVFIVINIENSKSLANKFVKEMENVVVQVANKKITKELLYEIINSLLNEEDFSENLKLKIIQATQ